MTDKVVLNLIKDEYKRRDKIRDKIVRNDEL